MKLKTFYSENKNGNNFIVSGGELNHMTNVYRQKEGDEVLIICNDENIYHCKIISISKREALLEILDKKICDANPRFTLTVFQCNLKADKIEFIVKALSEIGATNLNILNSENVVKSNLNYDRLRQISIDAAKQCGRSKLIKVSNIATLKETLPMLKNYDLVVVAHEKENVNSIYKALEKTKGLKNIALIVGPEGGLSDNEILQLTNNGAVCFGLNKRILRAETACTSLSAIFLNAIGEHNL